jgi:hypothetical protein
VKHNVHQLTLAYGGLDGKATRAHTYLSLAEAREAAGLTERSA